MLSDLRFGRLLDKYSDAERRHVRNFIDPPTVTVRITLDSVEDLRRFVEAIDDNGTSVLTAIKKAVRTRLGYLPEDPYDRVEVTLDDDELARITGESST